MSSVTGHVVPLSLPRRLVGDFVHAGRQLPLVPIQRRMELGELMAARAAAAPKPSWCGVFTKALAVVSARRPELRRVYLRRPWARNSVAKVIAGTVSTPSESASRGQRFWCFRSTALLNDAKPRR